MEHTFDDQSDYENDERYEAGSPQHGNGQDEDEDDLELKLGITS